MTQAQAAYSAKQVRRAVNLGAVMGWAIFAVPLVAGVSHGNWRFFVGNLIWAAGLGLPLALGLCWLLGAPVARRVMRKSVTWGRAAWAGAWIAAQIALFSIIIGRLWGVWRWRDPSTASQLGGGDAVREVDGILTTYGWWVVAQNSVLFVMMGCVIGLILRWGIGPGRERADCRA